MLRSTRILASLIRSLTFGTATVVSVTAVSSVLVGCKDESQPDYWVEKLEENQWKPTSIKRLEQFYHDALTKASDNRDDPEVKALLDKIAVPLTNTYVTDFDTLDSKTRVTLIKLLASMQDERTVPALKKVFEEFAKSPKKKDFDDLKSASIAAKSLREQGKGAELAQPMLEAFLKMDRASEVGGKAQRDLPDALLAKPEASWTDPLITAIEADIPKQKQGEMEDYANQVYRQVTAARLLGEIGDAKAVEPLMMMMLDPFKADTHSTALLALVKLGKPAADRAIKLLNDEDEKLKAHALARILKFTEAKKPPENKPYRETAAIILGTMGRKDSVPALVKAIEDPEHKDKAQKALFVQELTKIPPTDESKASFKKFFEELDMSTRIPGGALAHEVLTERAAYFFDPTMVDWLLERAAKQKGTGEDVKTYQANLTVTATKLMKPDQVEAVGKAVESYGTKIEKDSFKEASDLLKACGERTDCYLQKMEAIENQDKKTQFVAIKAGYMLAILGDEKTRDSIISGLDKLENGSVRYVASTVIDHLSPKGSKEAADELQKIIEKNAASPDPRKALLDNPLKQVMYRVRARAN